MTENQTSQPATSENQEEISSRSRFKKWRYNYFWASLVGSLVIVVLKVDRHLLSTDETSIVLTEIVGTSLAIIILGFGIGALWELLIMFLRRRRFDPESYIANVYVIGGLAFIAYVLSVFQTPSW